MVTYENTKVTETTVVFIARDSVDIFKVYGETVTLLTLLLSLQSNKIPLSRLKSPYVALNHQKL